MNNQFLNLLISMVFISITFIGCYTGENFPANSIDLFDCSDAVLTAKPIQNMDTTTGDTLTASMELTWEIPVETSVTLYYNELGIDPNQLDLFLSVESPTPSLTHTFILENLNEISFYSVVFVVDNPYYPNASSLCEESFATPFFIHNPMLNLENDEDPTTAEVTWTTNLDATSTVLYGTDSSNLNQTASSLDENGAPIYTTDHAVTLTGLASGTRYYYQILSTSILGNKAETEILEFVANPCVVDFFPLKILLLIQ